MNWNEMSPRERDALVATEVMGWERSDDPTEIGAAFIRGGPLWTISDHGRLLVARKGHPGPWSPTTDISAAWEVVEEMRADSTDDEWYVFSFGSGEADVDAVPPLDGKWWCKILRLYGRSYVSDGYRASARTMPEAICLAALRAKGVEV